MVFTMAVRSGWSRRAVLRAAGSVSAVGVLSGCAWFDDEARIPPPDPLEPLLAATRALADRYRTVLASHADLADRLGPLRDAHAAHAAALLELIGRPELASPPPDTGPATPAGAGPTASPGEPADPLAALREAERAAQAEAAQACLSAPPRRAALLGSITAARATHVEVLTR
jgi:hypothetical protein